MLNDHQITSVWEHLLAAETRALYFGDLTSRYTAQKQWITGVSFFLSSGPPPPSSPTPRRPSLWSSRWWWRRRRRMRWR